MAGREVRALKFVSSSPEGTEALGEALGRVLEDRTIVALDGDLGAGKTCFVRGLARGLGVEDEISSPTYALLQSYPGRHELHHLDAWMEGRERSFLLDGGLEWVASHGVTVIEWAERVADVLPTPRLLVRLEVLDEHTRGITFEVHGEAAAGSRPRAEGDARTRSLAGMLGALSATGTPRDVREVSRPLSGVAGVEGLGTAGRGAREPVDPRE